MLSTCRSSLTPRQLSWANRTPRKRPRLEKEAKLAKHNKHLKVEDLAAQRAVNTKDYLVKEKGIDASRISVATGTTDDQTVEDYLVPTGATFSVSTTPVDESAVKVQVRKPLPVAHHKKAAAGKARSLPPSPPSRRSILLQR